MVDEILNFKVETKKLKSLQNLFLLLQSETNSIRVPQNVPNPFPTGQLIQQDCYEYLGHLLNQLLEEEKGLSECDIATHMSIDKENMDPYAEDLVAAQIVLDLIKESILLNMPPQIPLVQKVFGGKMAITMDCMQCNHRNTKSEDFLDLHLSFPATFHDHELIGHTIQSLLDSCFVAEQMVDINRYFCEECKALWDGYRHITIEKEPANLILVVKHFEFQRSSGERRKLQREVHYDEYITLMTQSGAQFTYKLNALIVHCGKSIDCGHYYTLAVSKNRWYKLNDSLVSAFDGNINHLEAEHTPYILFYEQHADNDQTMEEIESAAASDSKSISLQMALVTIVFIIYFTIKKYSVRYKM